VGRSTGVTDRGPKKEDTVVLGPPEEDGSHTCIRKTPDGKVGIGKFYPEGVDPDGEGSGEAVALEQIEGNLYRVSESSRSGPAKVTSDAYRVGWDNLFGGKKTVGEA